MVARRAEKNMDGRMEFVENDVGELKSDVRELRSDVGELKGVVGQLSEDVGTVREYMKELMLVTESNSDVEAWGEADRV
ncbi:hypothetical protein L484_014271 [Morus notabilis]|uniref:Uncharacterized protein n=1 Tax=Morus notabilis TaxID=981085 RepID=W9RVV2_9ROSA|nr:hypothetical protein L484_014271 [Morus notabilis]